MRHQVIGWQGPVGGKYGNKLIRIHTGFGIVVHPYAEAVTLCVEAASHGRPLPVRHSLAVALYGDAIAGVSTIPISSADVMTVLATMNGGAAQPSQQSRRRI
jgi:hypothetical protein